MGVIIEPLSLYGAESSSVSLSSRIGRDGVSTWEEEGPLSDNGKMATSVENGE